MKKSCSAMQENSHLFASPCLPFPRALDHSFAAVFIPSPHVLHEGFPMLLMLELLMLERDGYLGTSICTSGRVVHVAHVDGLVPFPQGLDVVVILAQHQVTQEPAFPTYMAELGQGYRHSNLHLHAFFMPSSLTIASLQVPCQVGLQDVLLKITKLDMPSRWHDIYPQNL